MYDISLAKLLTSSINYLVFFILSVAPNFVVTEISFCKLKSVLILSVIPFKKQSSGTKKNDFN